MVTSCFAQAAALPCLAMEYCAQRPQHLNGTCSVLQGRCHCQDFGASAVTFWFESYTVLFNSLTQGRPDGMVSCMTCHGQTSTVSPHIAADKSGLNDVGDG
jgi:hypothetical protein